MKLNLNIAGSPAEVRSQMAAAATDARRTDPHANLIFSALSDVIGRKLAGASPEAQLVANIAIEISDATGLTQKLEEFVTRPFGQPVNQTQRDQAIAAASQQPTAPVVTRIDGAPMVPGPDGLIGGQPTNSGIPIEPAVPGEASIAGVSTAPARRAADQPNANGMADPTASNAPTK